MPNVKSLRASNRLLKCGGRSFLAFSLRRKNDIPLDRPSAAVAFAETESALIVALLCMSGSPPIENRLGFLAGRYAPTGTLIVERPETDLPPAEVASEKRDMARGREGERSRGVRPREWRLEAERVWACEESRSGRAGKDESDEADWVLLRGIVVSPAALNPPERELRGVSDGVER